MAISNEPSAAPHIAQRPRLFHGLVFVVFTWVIVGICFIYGVRLWFNSNIHPAFIPVSGAAFCAAIAFTIVLALEYVTGTIKLKFGQTEFEGASGPIILWCLSFFVVSLGLYMMGLADVVKASYPPDPRSLLDLFKGA